LDAAPADGDLFAVIVSVDDVDIDTNGNAILDPSGSNTGVLTLPGHPTADEISTYTFMFSAALGARWVIVNRQPFLVYGTTKVLPHASTHEPGGTDPVSFGLPFVVAVASQPAPKGFGYFTGTPGVTYTLDLAPADGDLVAFLISAESVTIAGNGNAIEQPDGSGGASLVLPGSAFIPEAAIYTFVFFAALGSWFIVNRQPAVYGTTRILDATVENGITASAVQAQGQSPLTVDVSEVTTVGLANDVVTLDQGRPGRTQTVLNFGANTLQVFPFLGDDLGFGPNVSTTQASGVPESYLCYAPGFLKKQSTGLVPDTREVTAGAGLTGGGDLSTDRTFDVVANADGSIVVNADDVQVGVLATDAQHGVRGGDTLHALVTVLLAGFMSAADKIKLNGLPVAAADRSMIFLGGASMGGGDTGKHFGAQDNSNGGKVAALTSDNQTASGITGTVNLLTWSSVSADATTVFKINKNGLVVATLTLTGISGSIAVVGVTSTAGDLFAVEYDAGTAPGRTTVQVWAHA
jgi:hypothetical protein